MYSSLTRTFLPKIFHPPTASDDSKTLRPPRSENTPKQNVATPHQKGVGFAFREEGTG
jgi:hypothetical protein